MNDSEPCGPCLLPNKEEAAGREEAGGFPMLGADIRATYPH